MDSRNRRSVIIFVALAFGLSWAIALPLWFGGGLGSPLFSLISVLVMFTPAVAAGAVLLSVERPERPMRALGIWPLKPWGRFFLYVALAIIVPIVLAFIALPVGALLGVYPADFTNFSGFKEALAAQSSAAGVPQPPVDAETLVLLQLVSIPVAAFINLLPALGEEIGWRGWLLPKLMPLGVVPALLISGVIWGLWHAPLVLLGYNYPSVPGWLGVILMVGMCIPIGAVFSWLRIRSETIWPPALAHGAFNASAGAYLLFSRAGEPINTAHATVLGWSGWIVPLIFVAILLVTHQFRPARPKAETTETTEPGAATTPQQR